MPKHMFTGSALFTLVVFTFNMIIGLYGISNSSESYFHISICAAIVITLIAWLQAAKKEIRIKEKEQDLIISEIHRNTDQVAKVIGMQNTNPDQVLNAAVKKLHLTFSLVNNSF